MPIIIVLALPIYFKYFPVAKEEKINTRAYVLKWKISKNVTYPIRKPT